LAATPAFFVFKTLNPYERRNSAESLQVLS
jgi:hypothetical protein